MAKAVRVFEARVPCTWQRPLVLASCCGAGVRACNYGQGSQGAALCSAPVVRPAARTITLRQVALGSFLLAVVLARVLATLAKAVGGAPFLGVGKQARLPPSAAIYVLSAVRCSAPVAVSLAALVGLDSCLLAAVLVHALAPMVKAVSVEALLGVRKQVRCDACSALEARCARPSFRLLWCCCARLPQLRRLSAWQRSLGLASWLTANPCAAPV